MSLYARLADLPLEISGYTLEPLEQVVPSGWARKTTLIRLHGRGLDGAGEDVIYNDDDHRVLQEEGADLPLAGTYTLDGFSQRLDEVEMFPRPVSRSDYTLYRRWGFESAALDLALRQAGTSLAVALGIEPAPLTFVVSTGLGDPASTAPLCKRLDLYPNMRFKVDLSTTWTPELAIELSAMEVVDTVDLKGLYRGAFTGPPADPDLYAMVVENFNDAWIEDPDITEKTESVLAPHRDRITWDANIHSVADIASLPFKPKCVNIKPSRFGFLSELLRAYEYCNGQGITMYAGGQFEQGAGRGQAQYLASLFHPDAPNDIAPLPFNEHELAADLPTSPLAPAPASTGFRWGAA